MILFSSFELADILRRQKNSEFPLVRGAARALADF
jgi:hypothetical protein